MDCLLNIKGNGVGQYGKPKYDRKGPVRKFVVDNQYFYPRVFNHVKSCNKCDPTEILEHYLNRRINKGVELVTGSLVKLAYRYKKLNRGVPESLVRQFEIRAGIDRAINRSSFSLYELAQAVRLQCTMKYDWWLGLDATHNRDEVPDKSLILALIPIVKDRPLNEIMALGPNDDNEITKLIEVAKVMVA